VEAHCAGRSATLHDYRSLTLQGEGREQTVDARGQDKGHRAQFVVLRERLAGAAALVPDQLDTMAITLRALEAAGGHRTEESLA
jgi:hypothetical protein